MSKYTTEVRFICEHYAGLDESKGFDNIEEILTESAPKVFSFDFPIFDENYRIPLERKILRHYYTREIGEETVGLWKLRLNTRLNEIMPYYNQLYESELLKFNPFYDVDYTKTGNREGENTGNENVTTTTDTDNKMTGTVTDQGTNSLTDRMTGTITDEGTNNLIDAMTGTVTDEGANSLTDRMTGTITDEGTNTLIDEMTGTITDDANNNSTDTMTGTITDDRDIDSTRTDNLTQAETNGGSDTKQGSNANKNDHWDYYSDTPQGTVANLENLTYLTNARHITDDGSGSTSTETTSYGKTVNTTNTGTQRTVTDDENTRTFNTTNTHNSSDMNERTYDTTDTKNGTDTNEKTYNTTDTKNGTNDNERTYDTTNTKTGTDTNEKTYNTTDTKNGTDSNTKTYNTLNEIDSEGTSAKTTRLNSLEDYTEHVVGKMGGVSYAKMLQEFRDTFLNIDRMIIRDLSDLFFGLWE